MWKPEKLKLAMRANIQRPPRLSVQKAILNQWNWKNEAEEEILRRAPIGWKAQPVASWPVSIVLCEHPNAGNDGFWMNASARREFIQACLQKANELYS